MAQVVPDICPREKEFGGLMKGLREDLVRIVYGNLDEYTSVLFCRSGTINIDVAINSLLPEGKCDVWDRVEKYTDVSQSFINLIEAEKSAAPRIFRAIALHCRVIVSRTHLSNEYGNKMSTVICLGYIAIVSPFIGQ